MIPQNSKDAERILNSIAKRQLTNTAKPVKYITLKKRTSEDLEAAGLPDILQDRNVRPFDDGLYFEFNEIIKPKQIHFECRTDNQDVESCDFRLFMMDKERTLMSDIEDSWETKEII